MCVSASGRALEPLLWKGMVPWCLSCCEGFAQRTVFYKQRDANFYRTLAYCIAQNVVNFPVSIIKVVVFSNIVYWVTGLSDDLSRQRSQDSNHGRLAIRVPRIWSTSVPECPPSCRCDHSGVRSAIWNLQFETLAIANRRFELAKVMTVVASTSSTSCLYALFWI